MKTIKKPLFTALFLISLTFFGVPVQAQTEPATSAQVTELQATLIRLLTELLTQLQAQLVEVLAQQAKTDATVASVSAKVDSVVTNTAVAPVAGAVVPAPDPLTVSILPVICEDDGGNFDSFGVKIPLSISGGSWSEVRISYDPMARVATQNNITRFIKNNRHTASLDVHSPHSYFFVDNVPAVYHMTAVVLDKNGKELGRSGEVLEEVPASCQGDLMKQLNLLIE